MYVDSHLHIDIYTMGLLGEVVHPSCGRPGPVHLVSEPGYCKKARTGSQGAPKSLMDPKGSPRLSWYQHLWLLHLKFQ